MHSGEHGWSVLAGPCSVGCVTADSRTALAKALGGDWEINHRCPSKRVGNFQRRQVREGKAPGCGRSSQALVRVCADLCVASLGIVCYCDTQRSLASTLGLRGKSCLGVMCPLQITQQGCVEWQEPGGCCSLRAARQLRGHRMLRRPLCLSLRLSLWGQVAQGFPAQLLFHLLTLELQTRERWFMLWGRTGSSRARVIHQSVLGYAVVSAAVQGSTAILLPP